MVELTSTNATLSEREELSPLLEWVPTAISSVLAHMPGVQNDCCHFEAERMSARRDQRGRLRWNVGEFAAVRKNIRHLRRHKMEDVFTHTHTVPEQREWKMDQLQSLNVNYGVLRWQCDNALLLSFTRAVQIYETWDLKQWSVARHVSSLHSPPFVRMMGQINFPVSETRPWPMSLHLPPSILYSG